MNSAIDIKQVLRVINKITRYGQKVGSQFRLGELSAEPGFDGYTVTLADNAVSLAVYFHNKHHLNCKRDIDFDSFLLKISHLDKKQFSQQA